MTDINEMVKQGRTLPLSSVAFIEFADKCSLAIQDVLAVHEIDEDNYTLRYEGNDNQVRYETCKCMDDYPCETRQKIINRLGGMK